VKLWNELSEELKTKTLTKFKQLFKETLINNYWNNKTVEIMKRFAASNIKFGQLKFLVLNQSLKLIPYFLYFPLFLSIYLFKSFIVNCQYIYLSLYVFMLVCIVSPIGAHQVNAMITLKYNVAIPQLAYHKVTKNCIIESGKTWPDERCLSLLMQSRYREHQTRKSNGCISAPWQLVNVTFFCFMYFVFFFKTFL